jgi:hypothetical protein
MFAFLCISCGMIIVAAFIGLLTKVLPNTDDWRNDE